MRPGEVLFLQEKEESPGLNEVLYVSSSAKWREYTQKSKEASSLNQLECNYPPHFQPMGGACSGMWKCRFPKETPVSVYSACQEGRPGGFHSAFQVVVH